MLTADDENTLIGACNILDTVKQEWGEAWSSWDQGIRESLSAMLKRSSEAALSSVEDPPSQYINEAHHQVCQLRYITAEEAHAKDYGCTCPHAVSSVEDTAPNAWEETAAQFARNADYYRGIVVQIGEMLGPEAYVSDDGSVQQDVLCAKVAELVKAKLGELARAKDALRAITLSAIQGETDECLICEICDGHSEDCPIAEAERLLETK